MGIVVAVIILLLIVTLVAGLRAYGYPTYLKERDPFTGNTKEERFRNWILMTTLLWATIIPFFVILPFMMQLGYDIAIRYDIPTQGRSANIWYALGYVLLVALPASALGSLMGKSVWKRIAGHYVNKRFVERLLKDPWWKRAGGD